MIYGRKIGELPSPYSGDKLIRKKIR